MLARSHLGAPLELHFLNPGNPLIRHRKDTNTHMNTEESKRGGRLSSTAARVPAASSVSDDSLLEFSKIARALLEPLGGI